MSDYERLLYAQHPVMFDLMAPFSCHKMDMVTHKMTWMRYEILEDVLWFQHDGNSLVRRMPGPALPVLR